MSTSGTSERISTSTHEDKEGDIRDTQALLTQRPSVVNLQRLLAQPQNSANRINQIWCKVSLDDELPPSTLDTSSSRFVCSCEKLDIGDGSYEEKEENGTTPQPNLVTTLLDEPQVPKSNMDEVWSNVFLGDKTAAEELELLKDLNITHVLNAAEGDEENQVTAKTYSDTDIKYLGFKVIDDPSFDISPLLQPGALFIKQGISFPGKVLVFCTMGKSRAAAFVLAYLMFYENLMLEDALQCINRPQNVNPNSGFLSQLQDLDKKLFNQKKKKCSCRHQ